MNTRPVADVKRPQHTGVNARVTVFFDAIMCLYAAGIKSVYESKRGFE